MSFQSCGMETDREGVMPNLESKPPRRDNAACEGDHHVSEGGHNC